MSWAAKQEIGPVKDHMSPPAVPVLMPERVVRTILETVARLYDLKVSDLKGNSRERRITLPRQIAVAMIRAHTNRSLDQIASDVGVTCHTTVIHGLRRVSGLRAEHQSFDEDLRVVEAEVKASLQQTKIENARVAETGSVQGLPRVRVEHGGRA